MTVFGLKLERCKERRASTSKINIETYLFYPKGKTKQYLTLEMCHKTTTQY